MKKMVTVFLVLIILSLFICQVWASSSDVYELQLTIKNNSENKDFEIYLLLPQHYIEYAIKTLNGNYMVYEGARTLQENYIIGIRVNKKQIQDEVYEENGIEYVQIKLAENSKGMYVFDILSEYENKDMKFRIKNEDKDYIMHIDNFETEKNICKMEYNYDEDILQQPNSIKLTTFTIFWIIILVLVVFLGYVSYLKTR